MRLGVFLVTSPHQSNLNVIGSARNREMAKDLAMTVLGGDKDKYVVTPITEEGKRTIFITVTETVE